MRKGFILLLLPLLILLGNASYADASSIERLDGKDRFEVAVNVSKEGWASSNTVVISNYLAFADALSAAPYAYSMNAPILLTHPDRLTSVTKSEIQRLNARKVVIVGGTASVSGSVEKELKSFIPTVERIDGKNRFEVAGKIAKQLSGASTAVVANGLTFPDALAIAPYAAQNGYPILLTYQNRLPDATKNVLASKSKTIVVGGEGSVGAEVYNQLPGRNRIGGSDRYEVAANIIRDLNLTPARGFIATGFSFADALTGSVLAAKQNGSLLLTKTDTLPEATVNVITEKGIKDFTILGGSASVGGSVATSLTNGFGVLAGKKLVVDAGHGDHDNGASGFGLKEKNINLDVALRLRDVLQKNGAEVVMTRDDDTFLELSERVYIANNSNADSFISIHSNTAGTIYANGSETYWQDQYKAAESEALATSIQKELYLAMDHRNRGVKQADYYVIKYTKIPSVLVELGFVTGEEDAKKLADPVYRQKAAEAIYRGVVNFYNN
ncbi:cell wall-binding repeat-containing protein [Pseudalkalibacillus caeni]|uniref:N-acetylmuramoyl-L-alanine amidase n=1 Tax=Exobacillus caeni TaxID=2574798 RepID=A0A5R9FA12_9BACL|nr:cell wall-binding repeat-containing protein [Pseudalkalibacillus caeni]TLS38488.1 N-acetylmuramoyl-L-alanine amidase [Pseudalkalibacillus caeni]